MIEIYKILYFLPAVTCLLWALTFFIVNKTHRQKLLLVCLMFCTMYFISYGFLTMPDSDYMLLAKMESLALPLAMILLSMFVAYIELHQTGKKLSVTQILYLVPGIMYGSVLLTLYYIIGYDDASQYLFNKDNALQQPLEYENKLFHAFNFVDVTVTRILGLIGLVALMASCIRLTISEGYHFGDFTRFIFKKGHSTPSRLVSLSIMVMVILMLPITINHKYVMDHPSLGIALAMAISTMIHFGCFGEYHSKLVSFNEGLLRSSDFSGEQPSPANARVADVISDDEDGEVKISDKIYSLNDRFLKLLKEDKRFLKDDIAIAELAMELNVGRTTLSTMINQIYGKNFRTLVNEYRIEYAKEYLTSHPSVKVEQLAYMCGFKDAPAFIHKFKELTGETPLSWIKG